MPGIIVGVDGSGHSQRALEWAMKEAAIRHAPLTVLTVRTTVSSARGLITKRLESQIIFFRPGMPAR